MKIARVALIHCEGYDHNHVLTAIKRGLDLLGGLEVLAKPEEKILLKPNMLVGDPPHKAVSPNPMVFQVTAELFSGNRVSLSFGDSPAVGTSWLAARGTGLLGVAEKLNIPLADFQTINTVSFPQGNLIKQFPIAKGVIEADGLISICKMKSHALTRITGAVKNTFGCVPGVLKSEFHTSLSTAESFSKMLIDLNLLLKPRLYIMDGIMAMEGNGPRNGNPIPMNVILLSTDPVALDTVFCRLINLDETLVDTIKFGQEYGLGTTDIEIVGDRLEDHVKPQFIVNRTKAISVVDQRPFFRQFMRKFISPRPVIDRTKCTRCGKCEEMCPAKPKALSWKNTRKNPPEYDYSLCIRCYCCQEICPHEAISVFTPLAGRLIRR